MDSVSQVSKARGVRRTREAEQERLATDRRTAESKIPSSLTHRSPVSPWWWMHRSSGPGRGDVHARHSFPRPTRYAPLGTAANPHSHSAGAGPTPTPVPGSGAFPPSATSVNPPSSSAATSFPPPHPGLPG